MLTATDFALDAAFSELATRAARTICEHHDNNGSCAACGMPSPCGQATLAAHNLELTSVAVQLGSTGNDVERCASRSICAIVAEG